MNINTKEYWDRRFSTDWETTLPKNQTGLFAETQIRYLKVPLDFSGTIVDFGCAFGDAMPVYRKNYKHASLIGVDISEVAIAECKKRYGDIAQFIQGEHTQIPKCDVIIASNIFEHLSNDIEIAKYLLTKCEDLYVIVPYRQIIRPGTEHVNSYDETYFRELGQYNYTVFSSKGYSESVLVLLFNIYLKNLLRPVFWKKIRHRRKQIMFHFTKRS